MKSPVGSAGGVMEESGGFQSQFGAVMDNLLKAAVAEATRLFERTLQQLRAELLHLRQENTELKTGLSARQVRRRQAGDGAQRSDPPPGTHPGRCDAGVQCEKPLMVERCCSPAPFGETPLQLQHITSDRLTDLCSSASEDGKRQLALLLIKKEPQETDCDDCAPGYFLLKQEGAEPILVRKEPFKNTLERVTIPSSFQTVTRCCGNSKETSTANTVLTSNVTSSSNLVSLRQKLESLSNNVSQTTTTSTPRGLTPQSDKDRKTSSLPEHPTNSSQPSVPAACSSAPTVSLSLSSKLGQISTPRTNPTSFSQCQNLVTDSCSSIQSFQAPVASTDKRVLQAPVYQTMTPQTQSSTRPKPLSLPPVESVIPHHKKMTTLGHFPRPKVQTPFSPGQRRVLSGQVPKLLSQLPTPTNRVTNPSDLGLVPSIPSPAPSTQRPVVAFQSQIPPVPSPVPSVKGPGAPLQGQVSRMQGRLSRVKASVLRIQGKVQSPLPPIQGLLSPQGSVPPHPGQHSQVQNPVSSVHGPVSPLQTQLPPIQGLLPPAQGSVPPYPGQRPHIQSQVLTVHGPVPPVHTPLPPIQGLLPPAQGTGPSHPGQHPHAQCPVSSVHSSVPSLQTPISPVQGLLLPAQGSGPPIPGQDPHASSPVPSVQGLVPSVSVPVLPAPAQVHAQSNENLPPHSQNLNLQTNILSVPHHNTTSSIQPFYPQTQIPFTQSYVPPQSMKLSVIPVSVSQTNTPPPLDKLPTTSSHYQLLSDPLCSSSDQFFPSLDNTSDLLQALPPMPFQAPIVLTQQEAALEQPSMIHSQTSGQPLQLAPLLTLKEQQIAASSRGNMSKRGHAMPVEMSGVNNFEEPTQRFLPCSASTISCESKASGTNEMHNQNSSKNYQDSRKAQMPAVREHYMVLSKPELNSSPRISPQSTGQPLLIAPLLTQKEQQAAASNQSNVSKGGSAIPGDIMVSSANNFDEHRLQILPCSSPTINSKGNESIEMHCEDFSENDQDSHLSFMPGVREHYKVLSKPEPIFRMIDSTNEQQTFRMNIVKSPPIESEVSDHNQTRCDAAGLIWETTNLPSALTNTTLSAPAPSKGRTLHKASRRVLVRNTECSECGRILSNMSSLQNHMRLHRGERPYICSQCAKAFPSVRGLNRHMKVHAVEKGYKCDECGRCFVYQFTLTKHKLIHSGDRPYPCKICGKKFLSKTDRTTHMRMHTGEKPFYCSQCGKSFKHRVALNMHLQGHKGEKRYVCPHCDKGFVDLGNFKRHKRIHTGEKPFECKACGKRFTQSAHLKKHANTQHAILKINPP